MNNCPQCQTEIHASAHFCINCGEALSQSCLHCQVDIPAGVSFCMNCGEPITSKTEVDEVRIEKLTAAAPETLVEKIRAAADLAGERRLVTAMFVDVVGSTSLVAQVDEGVYTSIINHTFDLASTIVYRYEGTISQLMGDELLVFFGAPLAHEDDPIRAVRAALELLEGVRDYALKLKKQFDVDLQIRITLSTGPITIGPPRGDLQFQYSALGGTLNLAGSLEATKRAMAVLISEETYRYVVPFFECTDLGEIGIGGDSGTVRMYEVTGVRQAVGQTRGLSELQSTLVGRDLELSTLRLLSDAVQVGLGRAALITGEPGLGKSRLIAEWKADALEANGGGLLTWVEGHCPSYGQGIPYQLVTDLLYSAINISAAASQEETCATLNDFIDNLFHDGDHAPSEGSTAEVTPYLGRLLSLELTGEAYELVHSLDPQALQQRFLRALKQLFQRMSARKPLILVFEDLQWADPSSVELLSSLLPLASTEPILFCLVTRPERDTAGWKLVSAVQEALGARLIELALDPLSEADSQQIISNLLQIDSLPEVLKTMLLEKSEGNPFFLEEVLRMLIDRGALFQANGVWSASANVRTVKIPDNLRGLLLARIDRLPEDAKRTLRVASVIGRKFLDQVLVEVLSDGGGAMELQRHLITLESEGLLRVTQVLPELEYMFRHTLVHETAYASLLTSDRERLHHLVGETLERTYAENPHDVASLLAHHFSKAGNTRRAIKYYKLAGESALEAYANQEAENRFRSALKLAQSDAESAPLLAGLGGALFNQSRFEGAARTWKQAIIQFQSLGDSDAVADLYARSARSAWSSGDTPKGLRLCQEGLQVVEEAPESAGVAYLVHEAARAYLFNGYSDKAHLLCQRALRISERLGLLRAQAETLATMGLLQDQSPDEAHQALSKSISIAESAGLLSTAARAHINLAALLSTKKPDFRDARDHYQRAVQLNNRRGNTASELLAMGGMVGVMLNLGELDSVAETLFAYRDILGEIAEPGPSVFHYRINEALLLRYQGELSKSARKLRALQMDERQRGNLQNLIDINSQIAELVLESCVLPGSARVGDWDEAESALQEAIQISVRWMVESPWPHCLLSMVRFCQGHITDGYQSLEKARKASVSQAQAADKGWIRMAEARGAIAQGRWLDAISAYEAAIAHFKKLGMRWWEARLLQELAEAYISRGEPTDIEKARGLLLGTIARFTEIGVPYYSALAEERFQALTAESYVQALAFQNVTQEMANAAKIQEGLLPDELPGLPGWQLAATLNPSRETSGDFYDFIPLSNGRLGVVIADVADKGAAAALFMAMSHSLIRTYATIYEEQPEMVLRETNRRMLADTRAGLFVTVFYAILEPTSGKLVYGNAGHNPACFLAAEKGARIKPLHITGVPLGIFEDKHWRQESIQLAPNDCLVLYTDGIVDAQNDQGDFFGYQRLEEIILSASGQGAEDIQANILSKVNSFVGKASQFDDITLVVLTRDAE